MRSFQDCPKTKILSYTGKNKQAAIREAARIIREGGLVAFPTETVYGLGADAFNEEAVKRIFTVKGRPPDNPLIVHIAFFADIAKLAEDISPAVKILAEKFWPGPLTMVLRKNKKISSLISAGLPTVALRIPAHPAAISLITEAQTPIAAPSANISGTVSATESNHVIEDLWGKIDAVLDGGDCEIGLESTVVDLSRDNPVILRPGKITRNELEEVLGRPVLAAEKEEPEKPSSPGMKYRHYAPGAPLLLFKGDAILIKEAMDDYLLKLNKEQKNVGILCTSESKDFFKGAFVEVVGEAENLQEAAFSLYKAMRNLDRRGVDIILSESFSEEGIGFAIMNRLEKAAEKIIDTNKNGGVIN